MKKIPEQTDFFADVGVAKASKAIKKEKSVTKTKKDSVVLAAANSEVAVQLKGKIKTKESNGKEQQLPVAENANGTEPPPKRHKKKDAKRLAKLAAGGQVQNVKSKKTPKLKAKQTKQEKNAKDTTIDHGAAQETDEEMNDTSDMAETEQEPLTKKIKAIPDDEQINTSESESESEQEDPVTQAKTEVEEKEDKKATHGQEHTVFVGNLPPTIKEKQIRKLFKKYGSIISIRLRTNTGEYVARKKLKDAAAINCYVRFRKEEHMRKACELNGHTVEQNRIRVTPQDVKPFGAVNSTVFVGNLRAGTTDTELYDFFSTVGEIEYVRQIANRYIAYVCFKKGVSIKKALKLDQQLLNGRPIRIQPVDPTITNLKRNKKGHLVKKNRLPYQTTSKDKDVGTKPAKDFHGQVVNDNAKAKAKKSFSNTAKAKRRIAEKLKAAMYARMK